MLNQAGRPITPRERFETPNPATPEAVIEVLDTLVGNLGAFDRVSVGFPGVVKKGATLTAHNLDPKWIGFELQKVLAKAKTAAGAYVPPGAREPVATR